MGGTAPGPEALAGTAAFVSVNPNNPWKPLAIGLALLLLGVLIAAALVATDVMKLGFGLL
jgi:hypothetical protein